MTASRNTGEVTVLADIEHRLDAIERKLGERITACREQGCRLDEHERRLAELAHAMRRVTDLTATVGRLSDSATAQALTLDKVLRNTQRLLATLETSAVAIEAPGE